MRTSIRVASYLEFVDEDRDRIELVVLALILHVCNLSLVGLGDGLRSGWPGGRPSNARSLEEVVAAAQCLR